MSNYIILYFCCLVSDGAGILIYYVLAPAKLDVLHSVKTYQVLRPNTFIDFNLDSGMISSFGC